MRKLKIYLDTSIINFLHADDAPEYMAITKEFFDNYINDYNVFISELLLIEINRTKNTKRRQLLLSEISNYQLEVYDVITEEIQSLSDKYIESGIIPINKIDDSMHIAFATFYEFDILLSWNFRHLANIKKQMAVNAINEREGYTKKLSLINPMEVIYEK
jgi:hypothetical protein